MTTALGRPLSTMKILHALVGYLAVTALHFHLFALAYPMASIDYDGYVNTTQNHIDGALMKHILGNIVEICQTNTTTQNHSDGALMKRVPGDIIEARQLSPPAVVIIISVVGIIALSVVWIARDDPVRGNDREFLVDHFD